MDGPAAVRSPLQVLEASGVAFRLHRHEPIVGRRDAEEKLGLAADRLLKTMVFRAAPDGFVLVALPATDRVSYPKLSRAVGVPRARLRQAEPDELRLLAMEPGGASPVCGLEGVVTVFDSGVAAMGTVYCGSGRADHTVEIDAAALVGLVRPLLIPVTAD